MAEKKILPALTTTDRSNWRGKIKEIEKFNIKEISIFPTVLTPSERSEMYDLLEKTGIESIPHVHVRDQDFTAEEINYLTSKYKTKVLNIHAYPSSIDFLKKYPEFREITFIENTDSIPDNFEEIVEMAAGICLDFSHYYDFGILQKKENYKGFLSILEKYKIGCNHVSAIKKTTQVLDDLQHNRKVAGYNDHWLNNLSEFDYLKNIPKKYFSNYVSIELENSFEEQLEVKKYLEKIINS